MTRPAPASKNSTSHYPLHTSPRVWFITAAASPIGISLARELLAHGDIIVAGDEGQEDPTRSSELAALQEDAAGEAWGDRLRVVKLVSRCEALVLFVSRFSVSISLFFILFFLLFFSYDLMGKGRGGKGDADGQMRV